MYPRNVLYWVVPAIVASGTWYTFKSDQTAESRVQQGVLQPLRSSWGPLSSLFASPAKLSDGEALEEAQVSKRRALVVENDQFYMGDIPEGQPLVKTNENQMVLEMLTPDQATQKLRQNEDSYWIQRGQGVYRYDLVQLASNNPIEDDHVERIVSRTNVEAATAKAKPDSDWMFFGVFDGHSGWTTSAKLRQVLISYVWRELNTTYKSASTEQTIGPSGEAIDEAIRRGFLRLDHDIVFGSVEKVLKANTKKAGAELLAPALSGSCALLSFYDTKSKLLRVACTGDARAVLGRRAPSGKWTATALSEDQTGATPSEIARLRKEHPGEEFVTRHGRILGGLEPSRAFGDASYKWSKEISNKLKNTFFGRTPSPLLKTPPYVTAEPVITTTPINPEAGDFVVMATDGLWECLTNEEVVGLVGQWLSAQEKGSSTYGGLFSSSGSLPVENRAASSPADKQGDGQRAPIRQAQWEVKNGDDRFVVEDKNAATHLIRNALGGKDKDMVSALLTLPSPYSRRYRDDLTVNVIFFGDRNEKRQSGEDGIIHNTEASASMAPPKAKL